MGVGAMFISTLALSRLPKPHNPPENQAELLAATLQTIVSFVVLGSIFIREFSKMESISQLDKSFSDGLSIPFFSFGRRIHTRTVSLSRTWTSRQPVQPDWLLWARRAPGPMGGSESQVDGECVGTATVIAPINEEDEDPYPESGVAKLHSDSYNVTGPNMVCTWFLFM
jgi:hypothetical protein